MESKELSIAMFSIHSSPIGKLGAKDTGGMSVYIRELARELGECGHRVDIYTRLHNPQWKRKIELYKNVRLIYLKAGNPGPMLKSAIYPHLGEFFKELEKFRTRESLQYDLIHSHYWLSGRVGNWAQSQWEVPHIVKFHTLGAVKNMIAEARQEPDLRISTEKHLAKTSQRISAATEGEKEQLIRYYGAPTEIIGVVPCGVNLNLFRPVNKQVSRRRLGFDHDESIILYVGRFDPLKGINRLLTAVSYLKHRQKMRLVMVGGDGDYTTEFQNLERLSRKLEIQDTVTFAGRIEQENLPDYYNAADVLVVPSYYESFGLVALEALACGTPVVATRVGAMENIIREGSTGHIVSNGSPRLLANGIETSISVSHASSVGDIRESVRDFSWAKVASAMIEEYAAARRQHEATFKPSGTDMAFQN